MSNNLLIVESHNDKYFIERLKKEITADFDIDTPICNIDDYECLGGKDNLTKKLKEISNDIGKRGLAKIGILLDADNEGISERIKNINEAVKCIDPSLNITTDSFWYSSSLLSVQISCYILNVKGYGELETLLKAIKSKDSPHADCLDTWRNCILSKSQSIKDKEFDKFWIDIYIRYDQCSKAEKKQRDKKCNLAISLQEKDIWDFSHPELNGLKTYLMTFVNERDTSES